MYRIFPLIFFSFLNFSKAISVSSEVDTTSGNIGNIFNWFIRVENYGALKIEFPNLKIEDENMSIRRENINDNEFFFEKRFEVIFWDTGSFSTPEYQITINDSSGIKTYIDVPTININILANPNIANNNELRPIIGPVEVKGSWISKNDILFGLLLFFLISILILISKRQRAQYKKFDFSAIKEPRTYAIERLNNISENCNPKEFYSEISHISREFFEKKYFVRSLEMTTNQIAENRKLFSLDTKLFENWIEILNYADKVKYAQELAKSKKMQSDLFNIKSIINSLGN